MARIESEELPLERLDRPRLKLVLEHWQALRGAREMPSRRDIDPLELKGALGIVMIVRMRRITRSRLREEGIEVGPIWTAIASWMRDRRG